MNLSVFACQQFAVVGPRPTGAGEAWQLVACFEAIVILVLFLGWLHAAARPRESTTKPMEEPP